MTTKEIMMSQGMTEAEADEAIKGIKRGLKDIKAGRVKPWSEVKEELNLS